MLPQPPPMVKRRILRLLHKIIEHVFEHICHNEMASRRFYIRYNWGLLLPILSYLRSLLHLRRNRLKFMNWVRRMFKILPQVIASPDPVQLFPHHRHVRVLRVRRAVYQLLRHWNCDAFKIGLLGGPTNFDPHRHSAPSRPRLHRRGSWRHISRLLRLHEHQLLVNCNELGIMGISARPNRIVF